MPRSTTIWGSRWGSRIASLAIKNTLECLCRYITRDIRVQLTGIKQGHDRYVALDLGAAVVPIPAEVGVTIPSNHHLRPRSCGALFGDELLRFATPVMQQ